MRSTVVTALVVGTAVAAGSAGYWLGSTTAAGAAAVQNTFVDAQLMKALQFSISSASPGEAENALWLNLGVLHVAESKPNPPMGRDNTAMQIALTYARLAQLQPSLKPEAKVGLLMQRAVAACQRTGSPNCTAEALSAMAQKLSAQGGGTK
jgi:hypothetical protein